MRKKPNKSGSVSIQVVKKIGRTNKVIKTMGYSKDKLEIEQLCLLAEEFIVQQKGQTSLALFELESHEWFAEVLNSIQRIDLIGPELILGSLFDQIGFNLITDELFKHLVLSRIINPSSKLKTVRDIKMYYGIEYSVDSIYRYMDKISSTLKEQIQLISYEHTLSILGGQISIVFYDVTTIYFEAEKEDDLRVAGFSKDGKHKHPQIVLGLLVSVEGYPLAYDIFPGNTYEGYTMLPIIDGFKTKYNLSQLVIVADSGLINKKNINELVEKEYDFIIGARIKNEREIVKEKITNKQLKDDECIVINKSDSLRLIIHYSQRRAKKDKYNRERGLKRLETSLNNNKLNKSHINNKGYNKYLTMEGEVNIKINYEKYHADQKWDGLKGYLTNTGYKPKLLMKNYKELWKIEKAFRVSKTDLRVRPIYHRLQDRIEAHICISFASYKLYKELERRLNNSNTNISVQRAIELIKTIQQITIEHKPSKTTKTALLKITEQQQKLIDLAKL